MLSKAIAAAVLIVAVPQAQTVFAEERAASVRAGHDVANTVCFSCHIVAPEQTIKPIPREPLPSFQEIANRPDTTPQSLRQFLDNAHWNQYPLPRRATPMKLISDRDKTDVIAYIMNLKKP